MTKQPDIFTNVHKGIRAALFAACNALGRAEDDRELGAARAAMRDALRFVAHHGDNEDVIMLPALRERIPAVADRIARDHHAIDAALTALSTQLRSAPAEDLYHALCDFTALYLQHMRAEELELEPAIRDALTAEDLASFGRRSIERTAPADQRMMLGWIVPAVTPRDAHALLGRLPEDLAAELHALLKASA